MAQPLRKTRRNGAPYARPPEIEEAIDAALVQDFEALCSRATIRDRKARHYLPSECLVHLIRNAQQRRDEKTRDTLLSLLLSRCAVNLLHSVLDSEVDGAHELREDILGDFAELFAIDGSSTNQHQLDFFEARFNLAFRAFRITRVRHALNRQNLEVHLIDDNGDEDALDDQALNRLSAILATDDDPEKCLLRKHVYAAIMALPQAERNALVLCRMIGFKEESDDPNERTAATLCDVTGRTIRNRQTRALAKLLRFKENA